MTELQDLAYERAVLSSVCQHGLDSYVEIDFITEDSFTEQNNAILFNIIRNIILRGNKPDFAGILSEANTLGCENIISTDEELSYVRSLFNFPVVKENTSKYAQKLAKLKILRDGIKLFHKSKERLASLSGDEDIGDILSSIEDPISELIQGIYNSGGDKPVEVSTNIMAHAVDLIKNPRKAMGIPTGIDAYDTALGGGLRRGAVDVVGARTKVGKSTLGLFVSLNLDEKKIPVLFLDTEMDTGSQFNRLLAAKGTIDVNEIAAGDPGIAIPLTKTAGMLESSRIEHKNVAGKSIESILAIARQWIYKKVGFDEAGKTNDCLIIYDYLKMTSAEGINNAMKEYQIMGFQMTSLHNFAVKYSVPVLAFVQLNKEEDVSQSDRILWLCTSFTKYREKSQQEQADDFVNGVKEPYNRKLEVCLSRFGPGLDYGDYINLRMRGKYAQIEPGPTRNELSKAGINRLSVPSISQSTLDTADSGETES